MVRGECNRVLAICFFFQQHLEHFQCDFEDCDSNFEVIIFQIVKVATNETSTCTLHYTICTWIALENYYNIAVKAEMNLRVRKYSVGRGGTGVSSPEKNRFLDRLWSVFGTFSVSVNYYTCTKLSFDLHGFKRLNQ